MTQPSNRRVLTTLGSIIMLAGVALLVTVAILFALPLINGPEQVRTHPQEEALQPPPPDVPASTGRGKPLQLPTPLATAASLPAGQDPWVPGSAGDTAASGPTRLVIPALGIDSDVLPVSLETFDDGMKQHKEWSVPQEYAAGWHDNSAPAGQPGNTVLNGHNNVHGAIFRDLEYLEPGLEIILYQNDQPHKYEVVQQEFLEETGQSLQTRVRNARWILPTSDERLTIVTCWPNTSNTHRIVVIAMPVQESS